MTDESKVEKAIEEFSKRELGTVKVLMVEDDKFLSDLVLSKLSTEGCVPYSVPSGEEALSLAEQFKPHVIILDLMLPGVSGEEILQKLKQHDGLKNIPIIVFTNKSDQTDVENNMKLGASEYLVKSSTDLKNLVEIVKRLAEPQAAKASKET